MSNTTKLKAPPRVSPSRRWRWGWILLAAAAGALAESWFSHSTGVKPINASLAGHGDPATGPSSDESVPVVTVRLMKGGIERTSAQIGSVHPWAEADLYAKISGYLKAQHVDYGDSVKKDQLLAEIDDPEVITDEAKADADVAQSQAAVAQAVAFIESAKADREAASTSVEQTVAEVERYVSMSNYHSKKFARYKELVQNKAIPQQIADEEEESYDSARASELASRKAVLNARAHVVAADARVKKAEADLAEAKASVHVADAKLAKAKVLVSYTRITSPYNGVVTKRNFFPGAFIRSAAEGGVVPLLTIARVDKVRVVTEVPDRDVPLVDVGDDAEVTLDAFGTEVFPGKVSRFADAEDPNTRTMHTEIDLPNDDDRIRPGMYGIAKIILDRSTKGSTLPASALVGESKGGKADVYIVKEGKAKKTQVTVGVDDGLRVEILSGLSSGDDVIANTGSVVEGSPVREVK